MLDFRYEGSCFFSKYLRVTALSRGNGTNYNRGGRSLVRSSVKIRADPTEASYFNVLQKICNYLFRCMSLSQYLRTYVLLPQNYTEIIYAYYVGSEKHSSTNRAPAQAFSIPTGISTSPKLLREPSLT
jgi:hypothetical protein